MQLGMIGLGRMGGNMVRRLMRDGHDCVVYARRAQSLRPFEPSAEPPAVRGRRGDRRDDV
jgi:6-phosphogluconate dehydrogenase (decarboxylating)